MAERSYTRNLRTGKRYQYTHSIGRDWIQIWSLLIFYFYLFYTGKIQIIFSCVCSLFKQSHIMQIFGKMYEEVVKIKIYEKKENFCEIILY